MVFELPKLGYNYDALEPFIDAKTMEIHYSKHHQAYVDKLNAAIQGKIEFQGGSKSIEEILKNVEKIPQDARQAVINHGGGHANHSLFWTLLKKDSGKPSSELSNAIDSKFGSFDEFKKVFSNAALSRFGSGWAWLSIDSNGKLDVSSTANQDSPLSAGKTPILCIDVWEHAYYLKYQNRRQEYIDGFWNVINWKQVEEYFQKAKK